MPKKVILDVDPGIADALLLCIAMFDPHFEVVAVTSIGGNVPADVAARNVQGIIEYLDPPRLPRLGFHNTDMADNVQRKYRHVQGIDTLDDTPLNFAGLRTKHPAEKVIIEAIRSDPENVMLLCCGPLTNLARAVSIDPELPQLIRHIYITGGAMKAEGNISACAEFNIYTDAAAAETVFALPTTKTLVPLDITNQVVLTLQHFERFPDKTTKIGKLLSRMLMPAFRAYQQYYALDGVHIHDLVTYMIAADASLACTEELPVKVETTGTLTRGMTVFDRRKIPEFAETIEVVTQIRQKELMDRMIEMIRKPS